MGSLNVWIRRCHSAWPSCAMTTKLTGMKSLTLCWWVIELHARHPQSTPPTTYCSSSICGSQLMLKSCLHQIHLMTMTRMHYIWMLPSKLWSSHGRVCLRRQRVTSLQLKRDKTDLWQEASAGGNSWGNTSAVGKHGTDAEKGWQTKACIAWTICHPPVHRERALWVQQRCKGHQEKSKYILTEGIHKEGCWRWHAQYWSLNQEEQGT